MPCLVLSCLVLIGSVRFDSIGARSCGRGAVLFSGALGVRSVGSARKAQEEATVTLNEFSIVGSLLRQLPSPIALALAPAPAPAPAPALRLRPRCTHVYEQRPRRRALTLAVVLKLASDSPPRKIEPEAH
jgi:hypothetical protein